MYNICVVFGGRDFAYNGWGVWMYFKKVTICDTDIQLLHNVEECCVFPTLLVADWYDIRILCGGYDITYIVYYIGASSAGA
jgi:hypothetical protein